jgi:hypothetical protein
MHHEPVLASGAVGPLCRGVLRRDHHEGSELVGLGVDGDLAFLHALEERGLRLGARAVDLVSEHDVREDGTRLELEVPTLLVEDVHAGHVGRQQVGGELDPAERAVDRSSDRLGEHRLADARDILDQDVPLGHQGGERKPDLRLLALHDLLDVLLDDAEAFREPLPVERGLSGIQAHLRGSTPDHLTQEYVTDRAAVPGSSCPRRGASRSRARTGRGGGAAPAAGRPARPLVRYS